MAVKLRNSEVSELPLIRFALFVPLILILLESTLKTRARRRGRCVSSLLMTHFLPFESGEDASGLQALLLQWPALKVNIFQTQVSQKGCQEEKRMELVEA